MTTKLVIALLIKFVGTKWIDVVLPPAAMGPVVALIGLELAGTAAKTGAIVPNPDNGYTSLDPKLIAIFCITLLVAIFGGVVFRGFASAIAILISIVVGYLSALAFGVVDFSAISSASVFSLPTFMLPKFNLQAILIILPATLVVISEHIGHQVVTSEIVGKDLLKDPGLHKSILADSPRQHARWQTPIATPKIRHCATSPTIFAARHRPFSKPTAVIWRPPRQMDWRLP